MTEPPASSSSQTPLGPNPAFNILRTEIIETQKTGADFVKWKLIAAAAVASLAIGVGQHGDKADPDLRLLVCLIPLICAYADLMSTDLAIRILSLAAYMRDQQDPYEKWVQHRRRGLANPFALAPLAVHASSVAMNLLILGILRYGPSHQWPKSHVDWYLISATAGTVIAMLLWIWYYVCAKRLARVGSL